MGGPGGCVGDNPAPTNTRAHTHSDSVSLPPLSDLLSGQILHTDVVYPHNSSKYKEADKLRHLMIKFRYCLW